MQKPSNRLITVWNTSPARPLKHNIIGHKPETWAKLLSNVFCPGPFYYYIFNFSRYEFLYIHHAIEDILGVKPKEMNLELFASLVHPEDLKFMEKAESLVGDFLMKKISTNQIMDYKVSYCLRIRKKDGYYAMILHQTFAISLDENDRICYTFGVHSDISHITMINNHKVSFISLKGGKSYIGLDVNKIFFPQKIKKKTKLTTRQLQVLGYLSEGFTVPEISKILDRRRGTIRTHQNNIRKRMGCKNTAQMVAKAIRMGLI